MQCNQDQFTSYTARSPLTHFLFAESDLSSDVQLNVLVLCFSCAFLRIDLLF
jgi:hypothetical protein